MAQPGSVQLSMVFEDGLAAGHGFAEAVGVCYNGPHNGEELILFRARGCRQVRDPGGR